MLFTAYFCTNLYGILKQWKKPGGLTCLKNTAKIIKQKDI